MRGNKFKESIIKHLKEMPIVQVACAKAGVSRATYYRWMKEDSAFAKDVGTATAEGEAFITDMSESQLITMIRDKNFQALQLWLRHHHPKYGNKVDVSAKLSVDEPLTEEQEMLIKEALRLAGIDGDNDEFQPPSGGDSARTS